MREKGEGGRTEIGLLILHSASFPFLPFSLFPYYTSAPYRPLLRLWTADAAAFAGAEHGLGVLLDLLRGLEVVVVDPVVFVLAVLGMVVAADLGSGFVSAAAVIVVQMLAAVVDEQVPVAVFEEHGRSLVQQVPADVLEILPGGGGLDGEGEIAAALAGTVGAEDLAGLQLLAMRLGRPAGVVGRLASG